MTDNEKLLKAKIPCPETGIEIRHTFCSICEPSFHCGIDAYIKDGKIIKVEGIENHPLNNGMLCTKGLTSREYVYRKDRIKTPLRRTGKRGSGEFEEISWEEAYGEVAKSLLKIRQESGPESVVFFSGYVKWYRSFLQRFAHAFGSPNFGTESSTCHMATVEAWRDMVGRFSAYDTANAATYLGWAVNPFYSKPTSLLGLYAAKERGQKVVVIDPRKTPTTEKLADLHLQIRPGTDGALALGIGRIIIENDWLDHEYVENHVYGFERYAEYVKGFDLKTVCGITGLNAGDIEKTAEWYATNKPSCISQSGAPIVHHINGYQTFRSIMALSAITGNYDVKGGNFPIGDTYSHQWAGFGTKEHEFMQSNYPKNSWARIGSGRFPLWNKFINEAQITDMARQIREKTPYPIRAIMAFGLNTKMLPESRKTIEAVNSLDFVMSAELFMTDMCRYSDIVLPVCTSFEREEFKVYPGGFATYINPVIEPYYNSKPDTTIIKELADVLQLDDTLLRSGYENCVRWMLSDCRLNLDDCIKNNGLPIKVPDAKPYTPGEYTRRGYDTPTGKFELFSTTIEKLDADGLDPLPVYSPPYDNGDPEKYPFVLSSGARLPHALHSRLHEVPWARSIRPEPMADINAHDAKQLGINHNDVITIFNDTGSITVRANPTGKMSSGNIQMYHGYREADANELVAGSHLDPYSGFPGYNCVRCQIVRAGGGDVK